MTSPDEDAYETYQLELDAADDAHLERYLQRTHGEDN